MDKGGEGGGGGGRGGRGGGMGLLQHLDSWMGPGGRGPFRVGKFGSVIRVIPLGTSILPLSCAPFSFSRPQPILTAAHRRKAPLRLTTPSSHPTPRPPQITPPHPTPQPTHTISTTTLPPLPTCHHRTTPRRANLGYFYAEVMHGMWDGKKGNDVCASEGSLHCVDRGLVLVLCILYVHTGRAVEVKNAHPRDATTGTVCTQHFTVLIYPFR